MCGDNGDVLWGIVRAKNAIMGEGGWLVIRGPASTTAHRHMGAPVKGRTWLTTAPAQQGEDARFRGEMHGQPAGWANLA